MPPARWPGRARHQRGARYPLRRPARVIGESNLAALRVHRVELITVSDAETIAAMRLLWTELKQVVEVSSATVLAAILKQPHALPGAASAWC